MSQRTLVRAGKSLSSKEMDLDQWPRRVASSTHLFHLHFYVAHQLVDDFMCLGDLMSGPIVLPPNWATVCLSSHTSLIQMAIAQLRFV